MVWHLVAAATVLLVTLSLVVARPHGLDVAWAAGGGAAAALVLGLVTPSALGTIFGDTWDAAATLIALFVLSEALDSNGFFTWAALRLARLARGSGWRLYLLTLFLTLSVTALLANDGAVLMLTPIYATLLRTIYPTERHRLPFIFAVGFFADAMSGLFLPSNLTNIILADANGLTFGEVAHAMAAPTLAAFIVGGGAFALRFRGRLAKRYDVGLVGEPRIALRDRVMFRAGWVALSGLVVGYLVVGRVHLPVALVAGSAALAMLTLTRARGLRTIREALGQAPWSVLVYAMGMFVVITAAYDAHALAFLTGPLEAARTHGGGGGALFAGGTLALLAALVNNLPATLIGVLALHATQMVGGTPSRLATFAIVLGVDIGPKLTPFGSLATLLWLGILKRNGIQISWGHYLRENWWVTLLALVAALGVLMVVGV